MSITCPKCSREYSENDFFGREICYKCSYILKTEKDFDKPDPDKIKKCPICSSKVPRHKKKYCSSICGEIALRKKRKEYWVKKLPATTSWRNQNFNFKQQES